MSDAIAAVTQLGASTSDTIIAVIGRPGGGKSSVCNRLCNAIDHPKDGRVVAEVLSDTSEPQLYNLRDSKCSKVLDVPGYGSYEHPDDDVSSFAVRNHLHAADCVLLVYSNRFTDADADLLQWCEEHKKPVALVQTGIHDIILQIMQRERVSRPQALTLFRDKVLEMSKNADDERVLFFFVDNMQWRTAIEAYEAGDYDAAQLQYDEARLLKFVTRAGLAKSTPYSSGSSFFKSLFETELDEAAKNATEGTQLETVLQAAHFIRTRPDQLLSTSGVSSSQTQWSPPVCPNETSRSFPARSPKFHNFQ